MRLHFWNLSPQFGKTWYRQIWTSINWSLPGLSEISLFLFSSVSPNLSRISPHHSFPGVARPTSTNDARSKVQWTVSLSRREETLKQLAILGRPYGLVHYSFIPQMIDKSAVEDGLWGSHLNHKNNLKTTMFNIVEQELGQYGPVWSCT